MPKLEPVAIAGQTATGFDDKSSDFEKLQWAIAELTRREKVVHVCDIRKDVNTNLQNRLVKLIGTKPMFDISLEGVESKALMDTGSQVAMTDDGWLSENAPDAVVRPLSDFLEEGEKIEFLAANNTEVPM